MNNEKMNKGRERLSIKLKKRDMSVSIFGLEKVPAEPLLKLALEKIGEQESYIQELEEKIRQLGQELDCSRKKEEKDLTHEIKHEAFIQTRKNQYYSRLERRLTKAGERIRRLTDARNVLIEENLALREQIKRLSRL